MNDSEADGNGEADSRQMKHVLKKKAKKGEQISRVVESGLRRYWNWL